MNKFMNALKDVGNLTHTENGATTRRTTNSGLLDLFSLGGAYRKRTEADCILLFKKALEEDESYAMKCLYYLRDILDGQGERRFFRVCMKWLAKNRPEVAKRNLEYISEYGRYDDLYAFIGTPLQNNALQLIKEQLAKDLESEYPSLLAKWLPSINASSAESAHLGNITRKYLGMTHKQYRKTLSYLRKRLNVLEKLMSAGEWDKIDFSKIPSKAGLKYRQAFIRHDVDRKKGQMSYEEFAKSEDTEVNAKALYPYEVVAKALDAFNLYKDRSPWYDSCKNFDLPLDDTNRLMVNKYWDNIKDYLDSCVFNGLAVVDTSGSMWGTTASAPINVAISLGMYCAERSKGPFAGHYISFSSRPQLIKVEGVDFCDKVNRIYKTNLCENTNIKRVFDMLLETAIDNDCPQEDLPENIIIISDLEFDSCQGWEFRHKGTDTKTLMENIEQEWNELGYKMPNLIFWNVDARHNNIPMKVQDGITFVSGFSPSIFEQIMTGKTAKDLMYEILNKERYSVIH